MKTIPFFMIQMFLTVATAAVAAAESAGKTELDRTEVEMHAVSVCLSGKP